MSPGKLDDQKMIIMNINSMLQKTILIQTWRIIYNIINTKKRKLENIVKKIIQDCVVHVDSGVIANMFYDYFVDIGRNIAESIGGNIVNHLDYRLILTNLILFSSDQFFPLKN